MATYHTLKIHRTVTSGPTGELGWTPKCDCGWMGVTCGTPEAAQWFWENNHVALFMTEEEMQAKKREAREQIRNRVLSKFIGV